MDLLDEIEKLSIDIEFPLDKTAFRKSITESRRSIEEVDEMEEIITTTKKDAYPMEITKIDTVEDSESFMDLLLIYGNVIKNAETEDKDQKKIHLENYMLGMNFQFGLMINEFSSYLSTKRCLAGRFHVLATPAGNAH